MFIGHVAGALVTPDAAVDAQSVCLIDCHMSASSVPRPTVAGQMFADAAGPRGPFGYYPRAVAGGAPRPAATVDRPAVDSLSRERRVPVRPLRPRRDARGVRRRAAAVGSHWTR